jgi:hypothetical protein
MALPGVKAAGEGIKGRAAVLFLGFLGNRQCEEDRPIIPPHQNRYRPTGRQILNQISELANLIHIDIIDAGR